MLGRSLTNLIARVATPSRFPALSSFTTRSTTVRTTTNSSSIVQPALGLGLASLLSRGLLLEGSASNSLVSTSLKSNNHNSGFSTTFSSSSSSSSDETPENSTSSPEKVAATASDSPNDAVTAGRGAVRGATGDAVDIRDLPRINAFRMFYPGQTYRPEELAGAPPKATDRPGSPLEAFSKKSRRPCMLCKVGAPTLDFRNVRFLNRYVTEAGKITPRRLSGNCAKHQRGIAKAIKRARAFGMMPTTSRAPYLGSARDS